MFKLEQISVRKIGEIIGVAVFYWLLARVGQLISVDPGNITPFFPSAGLALAAVLLIGKRTLVGVFVGSFIGNVHAFDDFDTLWSGVLTVFVGLGVATGATAQAIVGAWLIRNFCLQTIFEDFLQFAKFLIAQAFACLVSATSGVICIRLLKEYDISALDQWLVWYGGDYLGLILFAPLLLNYRSAKVIFSNGQLVIEAVIVFVLTAMAVWALGYENIDCYVFLFPLIILSAARGGAFSVSCVTFCISAIGFYHLQEQDFEDGRTGVMNVFYLQSLTAVLSVTGFSVAAIYAQRKQTEKQLEKTLLEAEASKDHYRLLVQFAPEVIVVLDAAQGKFVDGNENAEVFFNMSRDEIFNKSPADVSPPVQPDGRQSEIAAREKIAEALQYGACQAFEWVHLDSGGNHKPCEVRLTRLPSHEQALVRASIVDLSDRMEMERKLRSSIERAETANFQLRLALHAGNVGLWEWDIESDQIVLSEQFKQQIGLDPESELNDFDDWKSLIHPEDVDSVAKQAKAFAYGESSKFESIFRMKKQDGGFLWILSRGGVIRNQSNNPKRLLGINIDITDRKKNQEELENYSIELEQRNAELKSFAYVASHDLKSPLRGIRQLSEWIIEDCSEILPDESRKYLEQIIARLKLMDGLLSDLLNYSRAGRVQGNQATIQLREFISDVVGAQAIPDGFSVSVEAEDLVFTTFVTPLLQVISNLVSNAIKHHDNTVGTVVVKAKSVGSMIQIRVLDDGPGIPVKYHSKVFEVFETLKTKSTHESSGIGLSIVKKIVDTFGGETRVEENSPRGTVMVVTWPIKIPVNTDGAEL